MSDLMAVNEIKNKILAYLFVSFCLYVLIVSQVVVTILVGCQLKGPVTRCWCIIEALVICQWYYSQTSALHNASNGLTPLAVSATVL